MRLVSYRDGDAIAFGAVEGASVRELSGRCPFASLRQALPDLDVLREVLSTSQLKTLPLAKLDLLPPVPDAGKVFALGRNFKSALQQLGIEFPAYPTLFVRNADAQVGHGQPIVRPRVSEQFDYEGELAIVIGRAGRHIPIEAAADHIAGYTCFNDGSVRDFQRHTSQDSPGKSFWRSGAAGPWLVTADEIEDPGQLRLTTQVNGSVVQSGQMNDLIFDAPKVIAYLSSIMLLQPGDTIALGTPYGVGSNAKPPRWLKPGDRVRIEIIGIGVLENEVVDEAAITMAAA